MLQGLHQILHKPKAAKQATTAPQATPRNPEAYPVQTADTLLATEKRQQQLKTIKALLNLPPKLFDSLYYQAIKRFAEFVQNLPQTQRGVFANNGGFLDHGIERATRALSLCLSYYFPNEETFQKISSQEALWIYAVFTAALFLDVGNIPVKYKIQLCKREGTVLKDWLPYSGAMVNQASYYKYDFVKENRDTLQRLTTGLIARQLLTETTTEDGGSTGGSGGGFNWLASNPIVLEAWLNMLTTEGRPRGSFMTVIPLAEIQTIEAHLAAIKAPGNYQPAGLFTTPDENILPPMEAGKDFYDWLNKRLVAGEVADLAKAGMQFVQEGVLLTSEVFQVFTQENDKYKTTDSGMVEQQFKDLMRVYGASIGEMTTRYSHIQGVAAALQNRYLPTINPSLQTAMGQVILNPVSTTPPTRNTGSDTNYTYNNILFNNRVTSATPIVTTDKSPERTLPSSNIYKPMI